MQSGIHKHQRSNKCGGNDGIDMKSSAKKVSYDWMTLKPALPARENIKCRERGEGRDTKSHRVSVRICVCVWIYICIYIYVHILCAKNMAFTLWLLHRFGNLYNCHCNSRYPMVVWPSSNQRIYIYIYTLENKAK